MRITLAERITTLNERRKYALVDDRRDIDHELRVACKLLACASPVLDAGVRLDHEGSTRRRLVFVTSYKHDLGRTRHTVIACRSGVRGNKLHVTAFGRNRDGVNGKLAGLFAASLVETLEVRP